MMNYNEVWERGGGYVATKSNGWLRFTQFRGVDDNWESMFIPNGEGTVEWRLGWAARIPEHTFLLIIGLDDHALQVPTGIMTAKQVNQTTENGGMSIAVRPVAPTALTRGMPIARMILLDRGALQAACVEVEQ